MKLHFRIKCTNAIPGCSNWPLHVSYDEEEKVINIVQQYEEQPEEDGVQGNSGED
jgi:hypothetical protein